MDEVKRVHSIVRPAAKDILKSTYAIKEGPAQYVNHKTKATDKCYLFLLNTCLLLAHPADGDGKHKLIVLMNLKSDIRIRDTDDPAKFLVVTPKKTFEFTLSSEEERAAWTTVARFALEGIVPPVFKEVDGKRVWDPRGNLSEEELAKLDQFKGEVDAAVAAMDPPLDPEVVQWINEPVLLRFLRARQWVVKDSLLMITESLKWRNEYRPEKTKLEDVEREIKTGKLIVTDFRDKLGRPVVYYRTGLDRDEMDACRIRYMMWLNEEVLRVSGAEETGMEKSVWLVDMRGMKSGGPMKTVISVSVDIIKLMQAHYPETLGKCFLLDAPAMFHVLWKACTPFIDPVTQRKVVFAKKDKAISDGTLLEYFDANQLHTDFGGSHDQPWDLENYCQVHFGASPTSAADGSATAGGDDAAAPSGGDEADTTPNGK